MTVDTQKAADLLQRFGGMSMPSEQQLAGHKASAYGMLDSRTRGRCVSIDANELIDLVACASALPALLDEIDRLNARCDARGEQIDRLRAELQASANYIDILGGDSKKYRIALNPLAPPQGEKDDH